MFRSNEFVSVKSRAGDRHFADLARTSFLAEWLS